MPEPIPRQPRDEGDTPFWLWPWPFREPDLPTPADDED